VRVRVCVRVCVCEKSIFMRIIYTIISSADNVDV